MSTPAAAQLRLPAQVVGLKNGWNTFAVLSNLNRRVHGKRCGQGHEVMIEFAAPPKGAQPPLPRP